MNAAAFWKLIDAAKAKSKGDQDAFTAALEAALEKLGAEGVAAFQQHLDERMNDAYTWSLWAAAYIMNDGCSDDGFADFRALLIANGKDAFEKAVKDPESLAKAKLKFGTEGEWAFESLLHVPSRVHEALWGGKPVARKVKKLGKPAGRKWSEGDDLAALLPKLAAKCADAEREDDCPLEAGTVFRIPVLGEEACAYYKVLARAETEDGIRTVVALLDHPLSAGDATQKDWTKAAIRKVRDADVYNPNRWWDVAIVMGWRESDSPRKKLQVLGTVELNAREKAIVSDTPRGSLTTWSSLAEDAVASFDQREWPVVTLDTPPARLCALSPEEILGVPSVRDEFAAAQRRDGTLYSAGSLFLFKRRDFERAAAALELATRLTPERHGCWLLLGAVRYALGERKGERGAEALWRECLANAPAWLHPSLTAKFERARKSIDTEGKECKLLSSGWAWSADE